MQRDGRIDEDGQALPALTAVMLLAGGVLVVLAHLGVAAVREARAQAAADAVALAVAAEPGADHHRLAAADGAEIITVTWAGDDVDVDVVVDGASASARAHREAPVGAATGRRRGLAPAMLAALNRADQLLGRRVPVASGLRSIAEQRRLWERRANNPYPVARPGTSRHELGLAVDIPRAFVATLLRVAADAGLCRPLPDTDPVHFELCPR